MKRKIEIDKQTGLIKANRNAVYCPPQYRSIYFRPVSGLMSGKNPNLHLPMHLHSGVMQTFNSFTVAGAVLALPKSNQSAPASRLTSMTKIMKAPEARRRSVQKGLMRVKF